MSILASRLYTSILRIDSTIIKIEIRKEIDFENDIIYGIRPNF